MNKKIPENPFILVDGSSYLFRAFHAPPHLTNSAGEPTGAIYGVVNMLRSLVKRYKPSHMAVVFDAKGPTFRNEMYAQYKANRPPMPDDLRSQIEPLHKIVQAMGLPLLCVDGVEADDVIGTLAQQAGDKGRFTLISTGDKDMAQLVNEHVYLINTMSGDISDADAVKEKFGVRPDQIIDYLALMGDSSDNIPGLPKAGQKTAQALLQGLESIDAIYENTAAVTELSFRGAKTMPDKLAEHKDQVYMSRDLATIKCDVPLDFNPDELTISSADTEALKELYGRCEFRQWLGELLSQGAVTDQALQQESGKEAGKEPSNGSAEPPAADAASSLTANQFEDCDYQAITDKAEFEQWLKKLSAAEYFAFDTETTSLNYMEAELVGVSLAIKPGEAVYIPVGHNYPGAPDQLSRDEVLAKLKPLLEAETPKKWGKI